MAGKAAKAAARRAAEDAIDVLKADPRRFKALLRSTAALAEEASLVLIDAGHEDEASKVRLLSKSLRGAALLPAAVSGALAKKLLEKALGAAR
jgi:hypothetical protein